MAETAANTGITISCDRMSMGESVVLNLDDPAGFPGIIPTWRPRRSFLPDSDQTQQPCLKSPAGNGWTSPKKLMHSPESLQPIDWEEVRVRADAREWFSERISLIAWFWDDEEPGGCQPSLVARSFDSKQPYPQAVRREPPERMSVLLRDEWLRAGKPPSGFPKLTPWQDRNGRAAWHIDLGGVPEDQRILVGRALIRRPTCGVWDTVKSEIAYVGAAKIRYLNSLGALILEPTNEVSPCSGFRTSLSSTLSSRRGKRSTRELTPDWKNAFLPRYVHFLVYFFSRDPELCRRDNGKALFR